MPKKKVDKVEKLVKDLKLNEKERRSYETRADRLHPKKIKDGISQKTRAVKHFENGLEDMKKRKWDPETKSIEIKLEGGKTRTLTFKNEEEFNKHKQADIDAVKSKIEYEENKKKDYEILKKFKEAI